MNIKTYWDKNNNPIDTSMSDVIYQLRREDGHHKLMFDSLSVADILENERVISMDSLTSLFSKLEPRMTALMRVMERNAVNIKPLSMTITDPFKRNGSLQVGVIFELSDGQSITVFFHNPDVDKKSIKGTDTLTSWKWLLNKKDITILVAPERGKDIVLKDVAIRMMKIAEKNAKAFEKNNKNKAERARQIDGLKTEITGLESELKGLESDLEAAKIYEDERASKIIPNKPDNDTLEFSNEDDISSWVENYGDIQKTAWASLEMIADRDGNSYYLSNKAEWEKGGDKHIPLIYKKEDIDEQANYPAPIEEEIDVSTPEGYKEVINNQDLLKKYGEKLNVVIGKRISEVEEELKNLGFMRDRPLGDLGKFSQYLQFKVKYDDDRNRIGYSVNDMDDDLTKTTRQFAEFINDIIDEIVAKETERQEMNHKINRERLKNHTIEQVAGWSKLVTLSLMTGNINKFIAMSLEEFNDIDSYAYNRLIKGLEDINHHSEVVVLKAMRAGSLDLKQRALDIMNEHEKVGSLSAELFDERSAIEKEIKGSEQPIDPIAEENIKKAGLSKALSNKVTNHLRDNPDSKLLPSPKALKIIGENTIRALGAELEGNGFEKKGENEWSNDSFKTTISVVKDKKASTGYKIIINGNSAVSLDATKTIKEAKLWNGALPFDLDVKAFVADIVLNMSVVDDEPLIEEISTPIEAPSEDGEVIKEDEGMIEKLAQEPDEKIEDISKDEKITTEDFLHLIREPLNKLGKDIYDTVNLFKYGFQGGSDNPVLVLEYIRGEKINEVLKVSVSDIFNNGSDSYYYLNLTSHRGKYEDVRLGVIEDSSKIFFNGTEDGVIKSFSEIKPLVFSWLKIPIDNKDTKPEPEPTFKSLDQEEEDAILETIPLNADQEGTFNVNIISVGRKWIKANFEGKSFNIQIAINPVSKNWKAGDKVSFFGKKHVKKNKYATVTTLYPVRGDDKIKEQRSKIQKINDGTYGDLTIKGTESGYDITFDYDEDIIDSLKELIPEDLRSYSNKVWFVDTLATDELVEFINKFDSGESNQDEVEPEVDNNEVKTSKGETTDFINELDGLMDEDDPKLLGDKLDIIADRIEELGLMDELEPKLNEVADRITLLLKEIEDNSEVA